MIIPAILFAVSGCGGIVAAAAQLAACGKLVISGGCGSGSGNGSASAIASAVASYSRSEPKSISSATIQTLGSTSSNTASAAAAGYGTASTTFPVYNYRNCCGVKGEIPETSVNFQLFPDTHIVDTKADDAWAAGWTGLGQSISIIDDHSNVSIHGKTSFSTNRVWISDSPHPFTIASGTESYTLTIDAGFSISHGELVSNIAGGGGNLSSQSKVLKYDVSSFTKGNCSGGNGVCMTLYNNWIHPTTESFASDESTNYSRAAGVAKDAMMINNHVDLSDNQNIDETLYGIVSHMQNSSDTAATNISIGLSIATAGVSYSQFKTELALFGDLPAIDSVITVAAGNNGAACIDSNLNGCNAIAMAMAIDPNTSSNTIIVGTTTGSGFSESIANYSSRAGMFADQFLVANGDTGIFSQSNNSELQGTSFAAPRVAGAAAISRQKFPSLTGTNAAAILLLTASKDINNDGTNDFTGTSSTYGQGKLDLTAALSPIGSLAIQ